MTVQVRKNCVELLEHGRYCTRNECQNKSIIHEGNVSRGLIIFVHEQALKNVRDPSPEVNIYGRSRICNLAERIGLLTYMLAPLELTFPDGLYLLKATNVEILVTLGQCEY